MIVVSDTSPIRGLISIGKIDILKDLFKRIIIPKALRDELLRIRAIHSDIESLLNQDWIEIVEIKNKQKLHDLINY